MAKKRPINWVGLILSAMAILLIAHISAMFPQGLFGLIKSFLSGNVK